VDDRLAAQRVLLLDGGMGSELRRRGVMVDDGVWSANALMSAPDVVRQVHLDDLHAGADIITTNSYGITRRALAKAGFEDDYERLNRLAGALAAEARDGVQREAGRRALVAGSLPPLRGTFRPDLVGPYDEIRPLYAEQAELLAPFVDLFLCETMSSAAEAFAAASAATATGKPVWVAWTLDDDRSGRLRSGETISQAAAALASLPIAGVLANCCAPESISAAIGELANQGKARCGGYANAYRPVPANWVMDGTKPTDGKLTMRTDLSPDAYARFARKWLAQGATVIGGCCGIGPEHIALIRRLLDDAT